MKPISLCLACLLAACSSPPLLEPEKVVDASAPVRPRARALGISFGKLPTGPWNAITDVAGVQVGHATVRRGDSVRTGVTIIRPHGGNLFQSKRPAAICVANGFGKLVGLSQVRELGELESPIALTNTLSVGRVMDALVGAALETPGNEKVRSVNVIVGETNDGRLNDIRGRHITAEHVAQALGAARNGPVTEGAVGAGTGTICFGWKGGIGTSSRRLKIGEEERTVGVLVQTNFGGSLRIAGHWFGSRGARPVGPSASPQEGQGSEDGSCMIVIATDAALGPRGLERLAGRAFVGMARTGASFSNGSGDYAIAFSTRPDLGKRVPNGRMSGLFRAVADATEEAIINSLLAAKSTTGQGQAVPALPIERVKTAFKTQ